MIIIESVLTSHPAHILINTLIHKHRYLLPFVHPIPLMSSVCTDHVTPTITSGCFFLVGVLSGVLVGTLVMYICTRNSHRTRNPTHTPPPPPLYEDIDIFVSAEPTELPLQDNLAYGHSR